MVVVNRSLHVMRRLRFYCSAVVCLRCQPPHGFTVAQFGPPSLPVPGTLACSIELPDNKSMSFQVIPVKGILSRLDQIVSGWPAYVPMSIYTNLLSAGP